ncbi:cation diffusion facilitator family transporter [Streptomyces carpaticus]|uniref:cation diffusion facilitator family transporter n=1 Tax=Streptomyces TaxID=1883 RepID=UPI0002F4B2A8|nr:MULTISPECIES: cation diffusion facilitator family transporter [Streptomyces]MCK1815677.1 cation diffusion facilitator family transporter [Streptomyces sp. XM4011]UWM52237.1 cation diffusion facilitator family transporter [Streptomyces carpaticus]
MGAGHSHGGPSGHGHGHGTAGAAHRGRLRIALLIALVLLVAELVGAWLTGSLALLADAGHVATDAVGIGLALLAIHVANRPTSERRTFGLARVEILAALANCVLLLGVGGYILVEAVHRLREPAEVPGGLTIVFGVVGLLLNLVSLSLLMRGQRESLNVRGAFLEVLADTLGSVAVVIAALVILTTGWQRADTVASLAIALMIVPRTVRLAREALEVLLEAAPRDVDIAAVRRHITDLPGVTDVHDLHVWTITSGLPVLSAHVVVEQETLDAVGHERMLHELQGCLGEHFAVEHCTFQLEPHGHAAHEPRLCH